MVFALWRYCVLVCVCVGVCVVCVCCVSFIGGVLRGGVLPHPAPPTARYTPAHQSVDQGKSTVSIRKKFSSTESSKTS